MGVFFQPWWGSTHFRKTSSSVLQRCSPFFLLLPSLLSPMLLFFLLDSALLLVPTTRWTACPPGRPRQGPPAAAGDHRHPELFGLKTVTTKPAESKLYLKCAIITILGFNKTERRVQLKLEYCK